MQPSRKLRVQQATPLLQPCEITIMQSLLAAQKPERVLEWGAGYSTVYWPPRCPWIKEWVAIEHSIQWYDRLNSHVAPTVDLRLVPRADYYLPLLSQAREFDFVIVDGLYRRCCLLIASEVVRPPGIIVLHDAGRLEYRPSWGTFPNHELLYRGAVPAGAPGEYLAFGLCVFWGVWDVNSDDWCWDYIV